MSKSKGNGIDPIAMIEKYGCDALRFTLVSMAAMGRDIRMSEQKIESSRHFINKLWNAARFALLNLGETAPRKVNFSEISELYQVWLLDKLESVKLEFAQALADYRFNDACIGFYKFLWNDFCDWFLELSKPDLQSDDPEKRNTAQFVLWTAMREILLLGYPVIPFVSAEIWQALPGQVEKNIALVPYPKSRPDCSHPQLSSQMEFLRETIIAIRTIRSELGINPSKKITVLLLPSDAEQERLLNNNANYIWQLTKLEKLEINSHVHAPAASATQIVNGCQIIVPLADAVDLADEIARMEKELGKIEKELADCQKKLHNESFIDRAPAEVVNREKERAKTLEDTRDKLKLRKEKFMEARGN